MTQRYGLYRRHYKRRAWQAAKAFVSDVDYESTMDDLTVECSELQWSELLCWIEEARAVMNSPEVKETAANPLPLIRARLYKYGI